MTCGAVNGGLTCDREQGHDGEHRGYNEQIDEPMFWGSRQADVDKLEKAAFDAGAELTLVALRDELSTLRAEQTRLEEKWRRQQQVIGDYQAEQTRLREALKDLLAFGNAERDEALTSRNREKFVEFTGWTTALERLAALSSTPTPEPCK